MTIEITATVNMGDINKVTSSLQRGAELYGGDMVKATKKMSAKIIRSLIASTVIAPKHRKVKQVKKAFNKRKDNLVFQVTGLRGKTGSKKLESWLVSAKNRDNALYYHGRIGNRGLAKKSWQMAAKGLSGVEVVTVDVGDAGVTRTAARFGKGVGKFNKYDCYVRITNELAYIEYAMKGGGNQAASTILDRAANSFIKDAEREAAKRLNK